MQYYRKEFDIILLFGMTELKAQLAWTEDVSFWFVFLPIKLTRMSSSLFRVLSDGTFTHTLSIWLDNNM
jgi:hypothetical protein